MNRYEQRDQFPEGSVRRIDLAHEAPFVVGPLRVDPAHRLAVSDDGEEILEPKVMQVLVALAREPRIWSRDDLIAACWDGLVVGDDAINRVISQLRKRLAALAGEAITIETVTKVGYQLKVAETAGSAERHAARPAWLVPVAAAALLLVVAILGWRAGWFGSGDVAALPPTSVTILPIETQASEDDALAVGLRSTLAATLNGTGRIRVSGLDSAEYLVSQGFDAVAIGEQLDQRYVVALSLDVEAGQVEVRARTIETASGEESETSVLRRPMDSILTLEAELAQAVARTIPGPDGNLAIAGRRGGIGGEDEARYLSAVGLLRQAEYDGLVRAEAMLRQLAQRHPDSGAVKAMLSIAISQRLAVDPDRPIGKFFDEEAIVLGREARRLAPDLAESHLAEAMARGPILEMLPLVERAAEIDPYNPLIQGLLSETRSAGLDFEGQWEARFRQWQLEPLDAAVTEISSNAAAIEMDSLAAQIDADYAENHPDPKERLRAQSRMAQHRGDLSEAVRLRIEALPDEAGHVRVSNLTRLATMRNAIGLEEFSGASPEREVADRILAGTLPSASALERSGIWDIDFFETWRLSRTTVKLMADEGRHDELVALFDRYFDSPDDFRAQLAGRYSGSLRKLVYMAPYFATSLRTLGRDEDAQALIDLALAAIRDAQRHGRIPDFFHVEMARVHAVAGDRQEALDNLEAATRKKWLFSGAQVHFPGRRDALGDSALASLRGDPVLASFDAQLNGWRDRERSKAEAYFRILDERTAFDLHH